MRDDLNVIEVTADIMKAVSNSYSADRIAEKNPVRKPFKYKGSLYISSGSSTGAYKDPRHKECAYQIVPRSEFKGTPYWYGRRIQLGSDWAEQRRQQPEGFYHHMLIKHSGTEFVMVGPPLVFVGKEGSLPTKQLEMF